MTAIIEANNLAVILTKMMKITCPLVAQPVKNLLGNEGDLDLISGLGRSAGEGKDYPFQYSGLENPMDCSLWSHKELDTTQ